MLINYISKMDPDNVHHWSGTPYFIKQELSKYYDINKIFGFATKRNWLVLFEKLRCTLIGFDYESQRTEIAAKHYASQLQGKLRNDPSSIVFATTSFFFPHLNNTNPKVFYTDACYAGMVGFYPAFSNFNPKSIIEGNRLEQLALDNCSLAIYSSEWAAKSTIDNYNVDPEKVKVVPFGANIHHKLTFDDIKQLYSTKPSHECHLLFCGVEWERKRGGFAVKVAEILNQNGLKTIIHIVGVKNLKEKKLPDFVVNHGFLSKASQHSRELLDKLFKTSHFLIVPTLAEAYGLVFAEACSYGLPSVATDVGGVSTIIKNDYNGFAFPLNASENEYANFIEKYFSDREEYRQLSLNSYQYYLESLNWNVAGKSIVSLLKNL